MPSVSVRHAWCDAQAQGVFAFTSIGNSTEKKRDL
jgi:hypothetical protein